MLALLGISLLMLLPLSAAAKKKPPLTKTISGAVLDSSNHGVTGASVMLTDSETHRTTAIYSGEKGFYSFTGLDPNHTYHLQAKYKGMVSDHRGVSAFDGRVHMVVNLVLNPPDDASASNPQ
ncbi:MAG TPA: carboxypeptidase-like regulatory domain-containing protein [Terriglobia bacterium]|nr:carboxypeptidase-like regulatory domain-containing protein [Terriglobia bacterium]